MPVTVENFKVPEFERDLIEYVKKVTIKTAESALREEVAQGFDASPTVITDGTVRKDYRSVRFGGKIEFVARSQMSGVVIWAMQELQRRSPVRTGDYRDGHVIMINGKEIEGSPLRALLSVKPGDRVQIVNPMPYAKKIEGRKGNKKRGIAGEQGQSSQARGGVYRVVLRLLVQRWGKTMFFDFKYVKLSGAKKVWGVKGGSGKVGARIQRRNAKGQFIGLTRAGRIQRDATFPALQFFMKDQ